MLKKLLLVSLVSSAIFASQTIELLGDKSYPPYSYKEDGKAKGVYVEVIKAAFSKLPNYNVKFNMIAWKRAIAMTKKGKTIGFFPPYYSEERTSWTQFSEPILSETSIVFAKEKTLIGKYNFPEDFAGTRVCLNRGFTLMTGGLKFKRMIENKEIKLIEANNNNDCLAQVKRDKADFYINDQLIDISNFPTIRKAMKIKENIGHIGFTLKDTNYPYIKDLETKFNTVIKQMKLDGTIDKIVKKYK